MKWQGYSGLAADSRRGVFDKIRLADYPVTWEYLSLAQMAMA